MQPSHLDVRESADSALLTYLQASVEIQKASLARELHDNLSGLILAALMDVGWAEEHSSSLTSVTRRALARAREALRSALDINRGIIEDLRPSLLDNVGLFAALSWELKQVCARAGLRCSGHYPPSEMHFTPEASIALFRIAQEALAISNTHSSVTTEELLVSTDRETITLRFANDEIASPPVGVDRRAAVFASMPPSNPGARWQPRNLPLPAQWNRHDHHHPLNGGGVLRRDFHLVLRNAGSND